MTDTKYTLAQHIVRTWVRLYTLSLRPDVRATRIAEVDSDLWEENASAVENGSTHAAITMQILSRWLMGIPSDLSWRLQKQWELLSLGSVIAAPFRGTSAGLLAAFGMMRRAHRARGSFQSIVEFGVTSTAVDFRG